ncbi:MAG: aminotransferase class I/II-fold pyridoxal phosphate-dependent enzyme [Candidatus Moranbacteria bacterium]|nr:aminotransferase class I/II-fold pyridoxal phosphate-dependent enzyme [Candidatus Moranbacteria bacterium]
MISERIRQMKESGIRKIFNQAASLKGEIINFSIGQPDFLANEKLKSNLKKAVDQNKNTYTPTLGIPELRKRIAQKLNQKNNIPAKEEEIIVTSGASGGIFLALGCLIDPGDEVILPDPYFVLYKQILTFLGAKIIYNDTYPDFRLNLKKLKSQITKKTKLVIINSPNNPTGMVYSKQELSELKKILQPQKIPVLSDEIYEPFDYDKKFFSIASIYKKTITINGFSKTHSITGWRIGYLHTFDKKLLDQINKLQQYTFVCAPSMVQFALCDSFGSNLNKHIRKYKQKRDYLFENLKNKFNLNRTQGAFYAFVEIPKNQKNFHQKLLQKNILTVPGSVFSEKASHFRISFAVADEVLEKGVEILKKI